MAPAPTLTPNPKLVLGTAFSAMWPRPKPNSPPSKMPHNCSRFPETSGMLRLIRHGHAPLEANGTSENVLGDTRVGEWAVVGTEVTG